MRLQDLKTNNNRRIIDKQAVTKVLVIEDNITELETLESLLEAHGFSPTCAKNAKEGIIKAMDTTYDIALIDINLPDGNGLDLLKMFSVHYKHMINIILTGNSSLEAAKTATIFGAKGYLEKPFEFETLERLMNKCLRKIEQLQEIKLSRQALKRNKEEIKLMRKLYQPI